MNKCMRECDKRGASTIVFPAIGTGNLGFPIETAAHIMVDEVCNYLQKNKCKSLSMVYFIIFMGNMYRTFCDELEQRKKVTGTVPQTPISSSKQKKSKKTKKKGKSQRGQRGRRLEESPPDRSPQSRYRGQQGTAKGDGSFDLGNGITVEILKGDITSEKTDVIVNTTNKEMSLRGGGVSVALVKKAGADLQRACDEIKPKKKQCLVQGKVLDTRSGNLQCKSVFHIVFQKKHIVQIIGSCIERAVELKYSSIAFPGIGTGMEGCPADVAASKIKDALYKAEKEDNRKAQAETVMKTVQWVRQDSSETHYDPVTNLEIEEAYGNIKPTYEFKNTDSGEHFTINFKQMAEIDHTMQDEKCKVRRVVEGKMSTV